MGSLGIFIQSDRFEVMSDDAPESGSQGIGVITENTSVDSTLQLISNEESTVGCHQSVLKNESKGKESFIMDGIKHVADMDNSVNEKDAEVDVSFNSVKKRHKSTEKRFSCEHCEFECRFWVQLDEHSIAVHTDKMFSCDKCEFTATKLMYVRKHVNQVHRGHKKGKFQCEECDYKALNPLKISEHQKLYHKKIEGSTVNSFGEFSCDKCTFKASKIVSLRIHDKLVHIGKGSFKCENCGFKASNQERLMKHQTKYHRKDNFGVKPLAVKDVKPSKPRRVKIQEEIFHCHLCDFTTHFKKSLDRHVKRFHEDRY